MQDIPNGFGKFYKKDESFYIGYMKNGKADGKGVFIFPDGSYYEGLFQDNQAQGQNGYYYSPDLSYKGGFRNNLFHGEGSEEGPNHNFKGVYIRGIKSYGKIQWFQEK